MNPFKKWLSSHTTEIVEKIGDEFTVFSTKKPELLKSWLSHAMPDVKHEVTPKNTMIHKRLSNGELRTLIDLFGIKSVVCFERGLIINLEIKRRRLPKEDRIERGMHFFDSPFSYHFNNYSFKLGLK